MAYQVTDVVASALARQFEQVVRSLHFALTQPTPDLVLITSLENTVDGLGDALDAVGISDDYPTSDGIEQIYADCVAKMRELGL